MKVCFCGLGSIGRRHLKNLLVTAEESGSDLEIHALRRTEKPLDNGCGGFLSCQFSEESQLDRDYDIVFITNPTGMHYETMRLMADRTRHMFIEKPIYHSADCSISDLNLNKEGIFYVAGPLRYSGVIQTLKKILPEEKIYCVRVICSSYLPDWRPAADYRLVYSARKALGGGVALDLIHEWDYLTFLFGFPPKLSHISGKYSRLEIDSEDLAVYIAEYQDKVIELHLDYFGRLPRREIEIFTEKGTIIGDLIRNTIVFNDGREQIRFEEEPNDIYLREMQFFMGRVLRKQSFSNLQDCHNVLRIALGKESV